jgi:hypothetical protein
MFDMVRFQMQETELNHDENTREKLDSTKSTNPSVCTPERGLTDDAIAEFHPSLSVWLRSRL